LCSTSPREDSFTNKILGEALMRALSYLLGIRLNLSKT
jgi:hypothetical protein